TGGIPGFWPGQERFNALTSSTASLPHWFHGTDSLMVHDGIRWTAEDIRSDSTSHASYEAGANLGDGSAIVVGTACPSHVPRRCRPLVLIRDSVSSRWRETPVHIASSLRLEGVWGFSPND